jgi:hypothetical protein
MSILNQIPQSQLSRKGQTGGFSTNNKISANYDNTVVATRIRGQVITQINPINQSNLAPAPGESTDQSYLDNSFDQALK